MAINIDPALSPHLVVDDAAVAIDFYVNAFGADELGRVPRADGKLVRAAVCVNGFLVMIADDFPEMCGGKSMTPKSSPASGRYPAVSIRATSRATLPLPITTTRSWLRSTGRLVNS